MNIDYDPYQILIIEDSVSDRVLIDEHLRARIGLADMIWAGSFEEAKHRIVNNEYCFDVVLLDLTLPDCSGEVLIENILALAQNIPVIVLTGYSDLSFAIRSMGLGISDYLLKDDLDDAVLYKSIRYSIERKKYISELQDSEKRYSDLFQISPQPAWCLDTRTRCFLEVNDAAIAHYGYSREEFLTLCLNDLCRGSGESLGTEGASDTSFDEGLHCHYKKDGQAITVELKTRLIYRQGEWVCLMLVNDVTAQREYILNIEHQNQMLQDIVWMQSHEVRAPLARILGLVQLLQISETENPVASQQQNTDLLVAIQSSSEELDEMIQAIVKKTEDVQTHIYQSPLFSQSNSLTL